MRITAAAAAMAALMFSANAEAHPGAKILTTGSKSAPSAMTAGVSFEEINGVHVFRGGGAPKADGLLGGEPAAVTQEVEIKIVKRPWRSFRRLRTQGFYSGVPYPSRAYTQGFYSGKR